MLKFITLTTAVALLAAPAFAQSDAAVPAAQPTRAATGLMRYDTNKDGVVDRAEWNAGQEARFKELDKNGDGKLSPEELSSRTAAGTDVLPDDSKAKRQAAFFQRMDSDKDGFVSRAEFMAQADRNFARCDTDKDGKISTAECRQALRRQPVDKTRTNR